MTQYPSPADHRDREPRRRALSQHERAVRRAEVRRLVSALRPFGVLRRDVLEQEAGAMSWHEADFDLALRAAIEAREIQELPLGFYALARRP